MDKLNLDIDYLINIINNSYFFKGIQDGSIVNDIFFENIDIYDINFQIRFRRSIKILGNIKSLLDLLNTDYNHFWALPNCALKGIQISRDDIIKYIKAKNYDSNDEESVNSKYLNTKYIDDIIYSKINRLAKKAIDYTDREAYMFFKYYSFRELKHWTLDKIGKEFNITRERVRQIIEQLNRDFKNDLSLFDELADEMKNYNSVIHIKIFIKYLIRKKLWHDINTDFFYNIYKIFLEGENIFKSDDGYILPFNDKFLNVSLSGINKIIADEIINIEKGCKINCLIKKIKDNYTADDLDFKLLRKKDTIEYISSKYQSFFIVKNTVYHKIIYYMRFGIYLTDVIYFSFAYIGKPVYYKNLTKFISKKNINQKYTSYKKVRSILQLYFKLVSRGTYYLNESFLPEQMSAGLLIKYLLKYEGPLSEEEIIFKLNYKFSRRKIISAIKEYSLKFNYFDGKYRLKEKFL